jgi:hypothetical protein
VTDFSQEAIGPLSSTRSTRASRAHPVPIDRDAPTNDATGSDFNLYSDPNMDSDFNLGSDPTMDSDSDGASVDDKPQPPRKSIAVTASLLALPRKRTSGSAVGDDQPPRPRPALRTRDRMLTSENTSAAVPSTRNTAMLHPSGAPDGNVRDVLAGSPQLVDDSESGSEAVHDEDLASDDQSVVEAPMKKRKGKGGRPKAGGRMSTKVRMSLNLENALKKWNVTLDDVDAAFQVEGAPTKPTHKTFRWEIGRFGKSYPNMSFEQVAVAVNAARVQYDSHTGATSRGSRSNVRVSEAFDALAVPGAPIRSTSTLAEIAAFVTESLGETHANVYVRRKFPCPILNCPWAFNQRDLLDKHVGTHLGSGYRFKCSYPGCGWPFRNFAELTKHEKAHERAVANADTIPRMPLSPAPILLPQTEDHVPFTPAEIIAEFRSIIPETPLVLDFLDEAATPIGSLPQSPNPSMHDDAILPSEEMPVTWTPIGSAPLQDLWMKFVDAEFRLSGLPQSLLVAPTGTVESPLIVRAHYPNFDDRHYNFRYISIKDPFNWSLAALQQKLGVWGESANDQILFHDLFCRRIPRLKPNISPHESRLMGHDVLDIHEQLADDIWQTSHAKFGLLLGQNVTKRWAASHPDHTIVLLDPGCAKYYGAVVPRLGSERTTSHKGDGPHPAPWLDENWPHFEHGFFVEWDTRGPTRQIRRLNFPVIHPEGWAHNAWTSTPGIAPAPFRLRYLALERIYDLVMALSLGRVSDLTMTVNRGPRYQPRLLPSALVEKWDVDVDGPSDKVVEDVEADDSLGKAYENMV